MEAHSGDIEESRPVFQMPESQWTETVAQEDILEKLNHEKSEQSHGIQESIQPIEDVGLSKKQRIDSSLDSILIPRSLAEAEESSRRDQMRSHATNESSRKG